MLKIKNLTVVLQDSTLLDDISMEVKKGEIHAIMGPKNSGKTAFASSILGNTNLNYKDGSISYKNKSILEKSAERRSQDGIFVEQPR